MVKGPMVKAKVIGFYGENEIEVAGGLGDRAVQVLMEGERLYRRVVHVVLQNERRGGAQVEQSDQTRLEPDRHVQCVPVLESAHRPGIRRGCVLSGLPT